MLVTLRKHWECLIYREGSCDAVAEVSRVCSTIWTWQAKWAGKKNIYVGYEGISRSRDSILAAIHIGYNLPSISQAVCFVD